VTGRWGYNKLFFIFRTAAQYKILLASIKDRIVYVLYASTISYKLISEIRKPRCSDNIFFVYTSEKELQVYTKNFNVGKKECFLHGSD
jgi:hypothetical protein